MSREIVETLVNAQAHGFGNALASFVEKLDKALEDGWQPGTDLPPILSAALTDLAPQVTKFSEIKQAFELDPVYSGKAMSLAAARIVEAIITKPEPVVGSDVPTV